MNKDQFIDIIEKAVFRAKNLPRTGWKMSGINDCESVSEHIFGTSFIAMLVCDIINKGKQKVSTEKVLRMMLIHDMGESMIGDIPSPPVKDLKPFKDKLEEHAFVQMTENIIDADSYHKLWLEYNAGETRESQLAKAIDGLEMMFQAFFYERMGYRNLDQFWQTIQQNQYIPHFPFLSEILNSLIEKRKEFKYK